MRSNPVARAASGPVAAVLAVQGPDGYISPDWYGIADQVPTWNYVAVHLRGSLHPAPPESLLAHLDAVSAHFEAGLLPKPPWKTAKMTGGVMDRMMRMIVPFRMAVTSVEGTWKLNQNKPADARLAAAGMLGLLNAASMPAQIAALMREAGE